MRLFGLRPRDNFYHGKLNCFGVIDGSTASCIGLFLLLGFRNTENKNFDNRKLFWVFCVNSSQTFLLSSKSLNRSPYETGCG